MKNTLKNSPYFGFIESVRANEAMKQSALRFLTEIGDCLNMHHFDGRENTILESELVEEIVLRKGIFYEANEARKIAPFECEYDDVCYASVEYLPNEPRPTNPLFAERDWCSLSIYAYCYGVYLQRMIEEGELTYDDLREKRKTYMYRKA